MALIREAIGADTAVSSVDFDQCQTVRQIVARTPANRTKSYKGVPLERVIALAAEKQLPLMATITQRRYLQTLSDMLDFAVKKTTDPKQSGAGHRSAPSRSSRSGKQAAALHGEPAVGLLHSDFYTRCAASGSEPFKYDTNGGWRFWLPLISLYTGARPTDICQLSLQDIRRTAQGTWFFDVVVDRDDDDDRDETEPATPKRLKTATSCRKIPIHPQLLGIGLLQYVSDRHASGADVLFPTLKPDKTGYLSSYPLKRFRETFLKQAVRLGARQTFYSFRHCFRDALRDIEAPEDTLLAIGGWSQGRRASDNCGTRSNPDLQRKYVEQIVYPGLDLSHLWVEKLLDHAPVIINDAVRGHTTSRKGERSKRV